MVLNLSFLINAPSISASKLNIASVLENCNTVFQNCVNNIYILNFINMFKIYSNITNILKILDQKIYTYIYHEFLNFLGIKSYLYE